MSYVFVVMGIIQLHRGKMCDAEEIAHDCNSQVFEWEKLVIIQYTNELLSFR